MLQYVSNEKVSCKEHEYISIFYFLRALKPRLYWLSSVKYGAKCTTETTNKLKSMAKQKNGVENF